VPRERVLWTLNLDTPRAQQLGRLESLRHCRLLVVEGKQHPGHGQAAIWSQYTEGGARGEGVGGSSLPIAAARTRAPRGAASSNSVERIPDFLANSKIDGGTLPGTCLNCGHFCLLALLGARLGALYAPISSWRARRGALKRLPGQEGALPLSSRAGFGPRGRRRKIHKKTCAGSIDISHEGAPSARGARMTRSEGECRPGSQVVKHQENGPRVFTHSLLEEVRSRCRKNLGENASEARWREREEESSSLAGWSFFCLAPPRSFQRCKERLWRH